jgi:hypothetical protein
MESTFSKLGGSIHYLRRLVEKEDKVWSAFNPSIAYSPKHGYAVSIRSSNYVITDQGGLVVTTGGPIRNRVWFAELDDDLKLQNLRQIDFSGCGYDFIRGVEDPKLLWRDGRWMFTAVAMERNIPIARHCECYMDKAATTVEKVILFEGVEKMRPEKNWMTAAKKPANFDYVYDGNGVIKDGVLHKKIRDSEALSALRGNTHLVEQPDGTYLGIMHRLLLTKKSMFIMTEFGTREVTLKDYHHFLVRVDENGWVVETSEPFRFVSPGIEFAAGMVERNDEMLISFGKDDVSSHIASIDLKKFKKMLKRIDKR